MKYAKIVDGKTIIKEADEIIIRNNGKRTFNPPHQMIVANGWIGYAITEAVPEVAEDAEVRPDRLEEILIFKKNLAESDYKVIKCMEASLCGEEMPYDIQELHDERNDLRRRINELENENENF